MKSALGLNRVIVRNILTMVATVWARTANTGPYNSSLRTGLACRLDNVNVQPARTGSERADLAALRTFMWDTTYDLPEQGIQIEITYPVHYAGQRWNVQSGTRKPAILPGYDGPIAIECDVRRAS